MRILILTNTFPSASETFVANHINGLARRGHEVTVVAKRAEDGTLHPPSEGGTFLVRYCSSPNRGWAPIASVFSAIAYATAHPRRFLAVMAQIGRHRDSAVVQTFSAARELRGQRFDVTHAEFGPLGNIAVALRASGVETGPICTSFRGSDVSSYAARKPRSYALLVGEGDLFLPVCEAFRPRLLALGFPEDKILVYHSAVALDALPFRPGRVHGRGALKLIAIGRFVEKKGFVHAVEVLAALREWGFDAELTIIGDGDQRQAILARAAGLGVAEQLRLPGWLDREEIAQALSDAHVYLGTSVESAAGELEGIPNVLKEAMAVGTPVVAFEHSGVGELVQNGITGRLIATAPIDRMIAGMADAVRSVFEDPQGTERMVTQARGLIEESYGLEAQAEEAERLYRSITSKTGKL